MTGFFFFKREVGLCSRFRVTRLRNGRRTKTRNFIVCSKRPNKLAIRAAFCLMNAGGFSLRDKAAEA
jgi:hypothetical protein